MAERVGGASQTPHSTPQRSTTSSHNNTTPGQGSTANTNHGTRGAEGTQSGTATRGTREGREGRETQRPEEGRPTNEQDSVQTTPGEGNETEGPGKGKHKKKDKNKNEDVQGLRNDIEDLKKKLGDMGNKPGEGAGQGQQGGGQQGGGGGEQGGGGGAPQAGGGGAPQAGGAQAPGQGQGQQGDINSQLQGLAAQCLMQGGMLGGQQPFGAQQFGQQPGVGGIGAPGAGGANPFQAGLQAGLGQAGGQFGQPGGLGQFGGLGQAGGLGQNPKQMLAAAYQQAVSNPQSAQQIRPETHALCQAALGGGGAMGGQQFGANPLANGLNMGQAVPGLGGVQNNFGNMGI